MRKRNEEQRKDFLHLEAHKNFDFGKGLFLAQGQPLQGR
jgi:hypothetical protein